MLRFSHAFLSLFNMYGVTGLSHHDLFHPLFWGERSLQFFSLWMPGVWSFTLVYQIDMKHIAGRSNAVFAHTPLLEQQPHR